MFAPASRVRASRRTFLRSATAASVGALLAACSAPNAPTPAPSTVAAPTAAPTAAPQAAAASPTAPAATTKPAAPTAAATAAPAAAAKPAGAEKTKLTVWTNDSLYVDAFTKRSKEFAAKRPEVDFAIEESPGLSEDLAPLAMNGFQGADLVALDNTLLPRLFKGGLAANALYDLKKWLTKEQIDGYTRWEMFSYDDKIYGVSAEMDLSAWYYQPAVLEKYAIDVKDVKTYDDFVNAGLKIAKDGKYLTMVNSNLMRIHQLEILTTQNDGGHFDAKGNVIVDSPQTIQAVQLAYDMAKKHKVALVENKQGDPAAVKAFSDGTVASILHADWFGDYTMKKLLPQMAGKWRVAPLPVFKTGGRNTATRGGTAHGVTKTSKQADLAWEFLQATYLDKENLVRIYQDTHYFPPMRAAWDDERVKSLKDPFFGDQVVGAVWASLAPSVSGNYAHPYKPEAIDITGKEALAPIFAGQKSVEQGLKDAAAAIRKVIASG
jgi:arabinosaccharide transport system substrate-binding protein